MEGTKRHNSISTVKLKLTKAEHNTSLSCQTTQEAYCEGEEDSCPVTTTILLLVKYAPVLAITQVTVMSISNFLPTSMTIFAGASPIQGWGQRQAYLQS